MTSLRNSIFVNVIQVKDKTRTYRSGVSPTSRECPHGRQKDTQKRQKEGQVKTESGTEIRCLQTGEGWAEPPGAEGREEGVSPGAVGASVGLLAPWFWAPTLRQQISVCISH